jgi:hypothetical protein
MGRNHWGLNKIEELIVRRETGRLKLPPSFSQANANSAAILRDEFDPTGSKRRDDSILSLCPTANVSVSRLQAFDRRFRYLRTFRQISLRPTKQRSCSLNLANRYF